MLRRVIRMPYDGGAHCVCIVASFQLIKTLEKDFHLGRFLRTGMHSWIVFQCWFGNLRSYFSAAHKKSSPNFNSNRFPLSAPLFAVSAPLMYGCICAPPKRGSIFSYTAGLNGTRFGSQSRVQKIYCASAEDVSSVSRQFSRASHHYTQSNERIILGASFSVPLCLCVLA